MSLDHILLGMLRDPATGYELGRRFADSAQHFWYAEKSQIYPTLKRLRERGLLRSWEAPSERGPQRVVYETTDEGRTELREWLVSSPKIGRDRLAYIAQTFFLGELEDIEASIQMVSEMRGEWEQKLSNLEHAERVHGLLDLAPEDFPPRDLHHYAALRMGIHQYRAKLAWCEETIGMLEAHRAALAVPTG